jgi:hypothetical protein
MIAERAVLGDALSERVGEVIERVHELTVEAGGVLDPAIEDTFRVAARTATVAVAEWISRGDAEGARDSGLAAASGFAGLATHRDAALNEVAKRCLRWRDCIAAVLMDQADELELSRAAVHEALWMTLRSFDVTLVRLCEVYEAERQEMFDELAGGH